MLIKGFGSFVYLDDKPMSEKEFQDLMDLAKQAAEKTYTKEEALQELVSAGILDRIHQP